jgi:hypothetical protein
MENLTFELIFCTIFIGTVLYLYKVESSFKKGKKPFSSRLANIKK